MEKIPEFQLEKEVEETKNQITEEEEKDLEVEITKSQLHSFENTGGILNY